MSPHRCAEQAPQVRHDGNCKAMMETLLIRHIWLVHYLHEKALKTVFSAHAQGKLIDIGCGAKPYEKLYKPLVTYSLGIDRRESPHGLSKVDAVATAYCTPVKDCSFDTVLLTAVLEHIEEPAKALSEMFRILKPGGKVIFSVPLFWHLHEEPHDFFRYTKYGLEYLLRKSGFRVIELKALSGFWVTFGTALACYLRRRAEVLGRTAVLFMVLLGHCIQTISLILDGIHKDESFTWAYLVVATKRQGSA
jgi:SAM-dependent methyltransferase